MALPFFLAFLLGHMIGDFALQPYWLVLAKRNGWTGLVIHVGVVTFITGILAWSIIPSWWVWTIILFIGHLFIDQFRTFVFTDNSKGKGLLLLVLDQIAHVVLIALIAWAATGWTPLTLLELFDPNTPNEYRVMAYLTGVAALIGMVPVLEAEITVAAWAAQGHEVTKTVEINRSDRAMGGAERIAAMLMLVTGYWFLVPLVFVPRLIWMIVQGQAREDRTAVTCKVATSLIATLIVGALLYNVPVYPIIT